MGVPAETHQMQGWGYCKKNTKSLVVYRPSSSGTIQLTSSSIDEVLRGHELVMINFYADWCRFSQILSPVYDEAANKLKEEFSMEGKYAMGKVDCDRESGIAAQYHVSKYPTLKLVRHGQVMKREYRGQRSAEAISNFIKEQLRDPVQELTNIEDVETLDKKKRTIIGYFDNRESPDYSTFAKVASMLKDECKFYTAFGEVSVKERTAGNKIMYRPPQEGQGELLYVGPMNDFGLLQQWSNDKCVPLVREITFENAEELTEEGLPFVILFHNPDDKETPEKFQKAVSTELLGERSSVNFLTADGLRFSHPLHHLGKSTNDLPVLAIDSFRHMYIFPHNTKTDIEKPGLLKQFIADLHSGKLHREFHHGPDPTVAPPAPSENQGASEHVPKQPEETENLEQPSDRTTPPESTFRKLAPSRNRYTILRDEL